MLSKSTDPDPNLRPHTMIAALSIFVSSVGLWQVTAHASFDDLEIVSTSPPMVASELSGSTFFSNRTPKTIITSRKETITEHETLPFKTIIIDNPTHEVGYELVLQEGQDGRITRTYEVELFYDQEVNRVLLAEETTEVVEKKIERGTKPKTLETPHGPFTYRRVLDAWSTSYDGNCLGCTGVTYTGTKVDHGICAVDPYVIPLGTKFYVPGYGMCLAADIGGGINGNHIDLGFKDVKQGWWSARWVTIYLP